MDIISDMKLTVSSLDSKKALTNIDKVYMDYDTSNLHTGMCEKNKLRVYRELKEVFECKKYLYGVPDMGSKLLFRFRSGTHGLNEELGRHITRNISKACVFCNCDCRSVEHVLWECPAYSSNRSVIINSLSKILCSDFHLMSAFEKTRYIFDRGGGGGGASIEEKKKKKKEGTAREARRRKIRANLLFMKGVAS